MPISAPDVIEPAFRHAKEQLLKPFRFGQWVRLAFVGVLSGEIGFGGCNFNYPANTAHRGSHQLLAGAFPAPLTGHPVLFAALIAALVVIGAGLLVFFTYISSVMRFVLFDSIIARECHIRLGWARRKRVGFRLFLWQLLLMLAAFAAFLIGIGIPLACARALGWLAHGRDHVLGLVLGGLVCLLIFLVLLVSVGVVGVMTKDFVVPQMALEDVSAMEGWRRLWPWLKNEKGEYVAYIGMKIVLAMGAALARIIVMIIVCLALLIPIGGVGVVAVLAVKAAGWTWNPYTIALAVVLGCIVLTILIFAAALISVPAIVFFPAYSIYFLAPRYSRLGSLLWPQPSTSALPNQPPPEHAPL